MVRAIIGVTNEIASLENKKVNYKKKVCILSNGIDVDNIPFTKFKYFDGRQLRIIFVASYFYPWHGLDFILDSLRAYKGKIKIHLDIVGTVSKRDKSTIQTLQNTSANITVKVHDEKYGTELDELFEKANIALSSLALYRKKMKEASPLKTREYVARGIPFVYRYLDTDLTGRENFALKLKETEKINIEDIVEFAKSLNKFENLSMTMRDFAYKNLDLKIKMSQLFEFLKELKESE